MKNKFICFLLLTIIIFSSILIHKINQTYAFDEDVYNQVYEEYKKISSTNNNISTINQPISSTTDNRPIHYYKNSTGNAYSTIGIIEIPKIDISYPIINNYSETNLNIAPTKFVGPEINDIGNFVIVGHNNWNKDFFSNLNELEINDMVYLTDHNNITVTYKVYDKYEIRQDNFSCLNQDTNGKVELTLITCIKYQKSKRLIIKCVAI